MRMNLMASNSLIGSYPSDYQLYIISEILLTETICMRDEILSQILSIHQVSVCNIFTVTQLVAFVCLYVLRFYGPVNPMGSCRVQSVYLTTGLLGRLSPLSG